MSKPKYTPGPWEVSGGKRPASGLPRMFWLKYGELSLGTENEADARLCAAAPDMAEALKALLDHYVALAECGDCGWWDQEKEQQVIAARAALAKAGL